MTTQPLTIGPNPLTNLREQIRAHWAEARPQMTARLAVSGKLESAIEMAALLTEEAVLDLTAEGGLSLLNAWEAVREQWAILPTEEDVPTLGEEPEGWARPAILDEDGEELMTREEWERRQAAARE